MRSIEETIAQELSILKSQVEVVIRLLDDGATIPFIARYRKEQTKGLTDQQLRALLVKLEYLRELNARRDVILKILREQDQLTLDLEKELYQAETKVRLEDLYAPYQIKRQTKAFIAKQAGLEPLANNLLSKQDLDPQAQALLYINCDAEIIDVESALAGAEQILMEKFSDNADLLDYLRKYIWKFGMLQSKELKGQSKQTHKYSDYFNYVEPINKIPSHRILALLRGRRERALQLKLIFPDNSLHEIEQYIAKYFGINTANTLCCDWLMQVIKNTWRNKLLQKLETEVFAQLREYADFEAIKIFANNLRDLLLAAPAGGQIILGLDPGIRTGVKAAVIDNTGQVLDFVTIFPLSPQNEWYESIVSLAKLIAKYDVKLVSIGNGTGSRETERLIRDLMNMYPDLPIQKIIVSEAGASVYSASELASTELPDLDVTIRGAVSIARRLQDPLAELVKIEPKAIGVGQYQHDINQKTLARSLHDVVEDCVNNVGVDLNLASVSLLKYIAGLNSTLANNIVEYRNQHGVFKNREQLKLVPQMGEKTYQQSAGFLRIMNGDNPLDASGIHPESYALISQILADRSNSKEFDLKKYASSEYSTESLAEMLDEFDKPNRDPRPDFKTVCFESGIEELSHLKPGMILEGVISNITNFGIFVDLGVHQDGLVHLSEIANKFVQNPQLIAKVGDLVKVRVLSVDEKRRRISLSMKLDLPKAEKKAEKKVVNRAPPKEIKQKIIFNTAMSDALSKLKKGMTH